LQEIQEELAEKVKGDVIKAEDVCEIVVSEKIQTLFARLGVHKPGISKTTAQRWLTKLKWHYSKKKNGMYIDGHERDDRPLFINGQNTNCDSKSGTTMGIPFLVCLICVPLSLSHTTSPYSFKTMK
jgi:hypothetical protein